MIKNPSLEVGEMAHWVTANMWTGAQTSRTPRQIGLLELLWSQHFYSKTGSRGRGIPTSSWDSYLGIHRRKQHDFLSQN